MVGRLANEKTLELNITHELLSAAGIGAIGFTQDQESLTGGDVLFPCSVPMILQFKAPKNGVDSFWGKFEINNNKQKNQHEFLDALARSGVCRALYVFPLIITDSFLTSNFGHLLDFTCALDADMITGNHNWNKTIHRVIMRSSYSYQVRSEKFEGKGFPARQIVASLSESKYTMQSEGPISQFIPELIKKLDMVVQKAEIHGNSEHTLYVIATNHRREKFRYLALPILIRGINKNQDEQVTFT